MTKENYKLFRELEGEKIVDIIISLFPPLYEEKDIDIDIYVNIKLSNGKCYSLDTHENLWSCIIREELLKAQYNFSDFDTRLKFWMTDSEAEELPLIREEFKVNISDEIGSILGKYISKVEFLNIDDSKEFNPHGVKLTFDDGQYLISTCGHDGNILQTTSLFNKIDLIGRFKDIGNTELINLNDLPID